LQLGPETVEAHNRSLIDFLFERLPKDRCVPPARSIRTAGALTAASPPLCRKKTRNSTRKLVKDKVITSLREGNISRVPARL